MLGGIIALIVSGFIAFVVIDRLKRVYPFMDAALMRQMFFYHVLLSLAYFGYILFNPSDSRQYYQKVVEGYRGDSWQDFYGTSTTFIEWFGYPFIHFFGFSYEAMMVLFSFMGFLGFLYFYIFFKENIQFSHKVFGIDLLKLTFFLPNFHFWSSSFGKGSLIFLGIGLFFFAISRIQRRIIALVIASFIIYHVRPHVMLVMLVSTAIGFVFSARGVSVPLRVVVLAGAAIAFFFIYKDVLTLVGINEDEFISQGLNLSRRARELSKATSGIDISQYSLPLQVFTFLYRPLFFDAPGILGLIVSFENVFYVIITLKLLGSFRGWKFLFTGSFLAKSAFLSFISIAIALAQVSGNLGLAMRQKSQVMILLMFTVLVFLDEQKFNVWKRQQLFRKYRKPQSTEEPATAAPEAS